MPGPKSPLAGGRGSVTPRQLGPSRDHQGAVRMLGLAAVAAPAWAQCSMCRTAAAAQGDHAMHAMNAAILVLLVPAVVLFCGVFLLARRGDSRVDE